MKYIGTMLSVFQHHNCICQVIIWTPEGPISYASESLIVIFLPWYNCCVYVLNGNKMFLNLNLKWLGFQVTWSEIENDQVGYRMAKKLKGLYKKVFFMNNDIKFSNIEWRTPYPLTNFEDRFWLRASVIFLDSNMCRSQTLVVNWQN